MLLLLKLEANNLQRSSKTNGKVASCEPNMWGSQYRSDNVVNSMGKEQLFIFFADTFLI